MWIGLGLGLPALAVRRKSGAAIATFLPASPAPAAAYGLRRMIAGYSGPAIRVRRASDAAETDIGFAGQALDAVAASAFQGASALTVTTVYDQAGAGRHLTQGAAANQPALYLGGAEPEIVLTGTTVSNQASLTIPTTLAFDRADHGLFFVARQYESAHTTHYAAMGAAPDLDYYQYLSAFTVQAQGSSLVNTAPAYATLVPVNKCIVTMLSRASGLTIGRDEASSTSATSLGSLSLTAGGRIGGGAAGANLLLHGLLIYAGAPSDAQAVAIRAALRTIHASHPAATSYLVYAKGDSITNGVGSQVGYPNARLLADRIDGAAIVYSDGTNGASVAANTRPSWPVPGVTRRIAKLWLATNNFALNQTSFTGAISGTTLTVSSTPTGGVSLAVGFVVGISGATTAGSTGYGAITALGTGTGGTGTYTLDTASAVSSGTLEATQGPAQVLAWNEAAADYAKASGGFDQVFAGTPLPRSTAVSSGVTNFVEAQFVGFIAALKASTHFDAVSDYGTSSLIGVRGTSVTDASRASLNTATFPDGIHPAPAGHAAIAAIDAATVNALLAKPLISGTPPGATQNGLYAFTPTVTGGATPYAFAIAVGSLPAGLSLNVSTGAVTGTPTGTGASSFTLRVTDAASRTADLATTISVAAASTTLLDLIAAAPTGAYSLRKLRAAYSGPLLNARNNASGAQADVAPDGAGIVSGSSTATVTAVGTSAYAIGQTMTLAAFIGGGSTYVATWYDQSANANHLTQATATAQVRLTSNAGAFYTINAKTILNGGAAQTFTGAIAANPAARTVAGVLAHQSGTAGGIIGASANGGLEFAFSATHALTLAKQGTGASLVTSTSTATVSQLGTVRVVYDGSTYAFALDGAGAGSGSFAQTLTSGLTARVGTGTGNLTAYYGELLIFDGVSVSSGDLATIQSNQKTYWGTP